MNGRKVRALRKQAALTAKTMDTDYQTEERIDYHGRKRIVFSNPKRLVSTCHRAVYQQLKQA